MPNVRRPEKRSARVLLWTVVLVTALGSAGARAQPFTGPLVLAPPPGVGEPLELGRGIAADATYIAIGDPYETVDGIPYGGAVYLFATGTGAFLRRIPNPVPDYRNDFFGIALAMRAGRLLIGEPPQLTQARAGAAHLYDIATGTLLRTFTAPDPRPKDTCGTAVAFAGPHVVLGCPNYSPLGGPGSPSEGGRAFVFDATTGALRATLANPTPDSADAFGATVAATDTLVAVGAYKDDAAGADAGAVHVFDAATGALVRTLLPLPPNQQILYGVGLAFVGGRLLVGAPTALDGGHRRGAVYVYDAATGGLLRTLANPSVAGDLDDFGWFIDAVGTRALVGAPRDDQDAQDTGAAHLFDVESGTLLTTFRRPVPRHFDDRFGDRVAGAGGSVVVTAPRAGPTTADNTGAAYLFSAGACGDAALAPGEECDDGNVADGDGCDSNCRVTGCGNRVVSAGEECDDGNTADGDCCSSACRLGAAGSACSADANTCTDDVCDGAGHCTAVPNTAVCDDGDPCTLDDRCSFTFCEAGPPVIQCDDGNQCTADRCDPATITCLHDPVYGPCDDGNACTTGDACVGTACVSGPPVVCNDDDPCTTDTCASATGCAHTANSEPCDDGNACTGPDRCDGAGHCAPGGCQPGAWCGDAGGVDFTCAAPSPGACVCTAPRPPFTPMRLYAPPEPDGVGGSFGDQVSAVGDRVVVGEAFRKTGGLPYGAVHVYDPVSGALGRTLTHPTPASGARFGAALASRGDDLLVGSPRSSTGPPGQAFVFDVATGALRRALGNPAPHAGDGCGQGVAWVGDRTLVGCYHDDGAGYHAGAAFLFDAAGGLPRAFTEPQHAQGDEFGNGAMAVDGSRVLFGVYFNDTGARRAGAAYLFDADGGQLLRSFFNPTPRDNELFGTAVAVLGNRVLVGAPTATDHSVYGGLVYQFDAATGAVTRILHNPSPGHLDDFGWALALVDGDVLVGAPRTDTAAEDGGAAYLFDGVTGALLQAFTSPRPDPDGRFGHAVAAFGGDLLITAPRDDAGAFNAGGVYLFAAGCGDGVLGRYELCDDGNVADGDGCSSTCGSVLASTPTTSTTTTTIPPVACPVAPAAGCATAAKLTFQVADPGPPSSRKLVWKWAKGAAISSAALGTSQAPFDYALCVWDHLGGVPSLVATLRVPPGAGWKRAGAGWRYADRAGSASGVIAVKLASGVAGKTSAQVKARGAALLLPPADTPEQRFAQEPTVTVQLHNGAGACWTSAFPVARTHTAKAFKARVP